MQARAGAPMAADGHVREGEGGEGVSGGSRDKNEQARKETASTLLNGEGSQGIGRRVPGLGRRPWLHGVRPCQ